MRSSIRATRSSDKIVVERSNGTHVSVLTVREARDLVLQLQAAIEMQPLGEIHPCTKDYCPRDVGYDDEPYCFEHSPMSGSNVPGYSYKASRA